MVRCYCTTTDAVKKSVGRRKRLLHEKHKLLPVSVGHSVARSDSVARSETLSSVDPLRSAIISQLLTLTERFPRIARNLAVGELVLTLPQRLGNLRRMSSRLRRAVSCHGWIFSAASNCSAAP